MDDWLATCLAVNRGCMGRERCWLYYPRLRLLSLPAFFCSFPVSPQCSASGFFSFPSVPTFLSSGLLMTPKALPQGLSSPHASCPTWLRMVPSGVSQMAAWFAERPEEVTSRLLFLLFMTEGTGPAKHFILSRECSRPRKWLSGTHPAEEPCVT